MLKGVVVACACALAVPMQARAQVQRTPNTVPPKTALPAEVIEVQEHRSPGSIIVTDVIGTGTVDRIEEIAEP